MKNFLLVAFLLITFSAFSQKKLDGTFETQSIDQHGGTRFTFFKNGSFYYVRTGYLNKIQGKGKYTINKKILKLSFDSFESVNDFLTTSKKDCKFSDSTKTVFYLKDKDTKQPIPLANFILKLKNSNKNVGQTSTDFNGLAFIMLPNIYRDSTITCLINVSYGLYKNLSFDFIPTFCKEIKIELSEESNNNQEIPKGTIWEYTIKEFTEKKLGYKGIILNDYLKPKSYDITLYKK